MTIDIEKVIDDATKRVLTVGENMVVVRSNVPLPPKTVGRKQKDSKYESLRLLNVNDHFTVRTQKEVNRILSQQKKLGMKFAQRKMPEGLIGIWVVAKTER